MRIEIPPRLTHQELKRLVATSYSPSFLASNKSCQFDWTLTEWISLPEAVIVLSWSSKLVAAGHSVEWLIFEPLRITEALQEMRAQASHVVGPELFLTLSRAIDKLTKDARVGALTARDLNSTLSAIQQRAKGGKQSIERHVATWLDIELSPLRRLGVLSYMQRYKFFLRAFEAGINVVPEPPNIPRLNIRSAPDTACLELRPVGALIDVGSLVQELNEPEELERVLGAYAGMDVARGGALANILITELGNNIEEHAQAPGAWLWTRLVVEGKVRQQTEKDPPVKSFREHNRGFLELSICDNGIGLIKELERVLNRDRRDSAISKYSRVSHPREIQLIDYAFDRLSSSKRDIAQLVHLEDPDWVRTEGERPSVVSSGLYWVWNVVRSHRGVLAVCTAGYNVWYDFTDWSGRGNPEGWKLTFPIYEELGVDVCGTVIRICLPLKDGRTSEAFSQRLERRKPEVSHPVRDMRFSFIWAGDLVRNVPIKRPTKQSRRQSHQLSPQDTVRLPGISDGHEIRLLQELEKQHFPLKDGDVLVLDLCGVRSQWAKRSVAPLCQFVLEMNYTSTVGRSAVVLWNVPASSEEVFELAVKIGDLFERHLEDANRKHSQLRELRRAVLLIFDNDRIRIFCGWPEAEEILNRLRQEGELDLDEIGAGALSDSDRLRLISLITENSHIFEWTGKNRVSLRIWPPDIRIAAWAQGISWFNSKLDSEVQSGGVHLLPANGWFRLPSTGYLVKEFYQFRGLMASHEACAKMAWHVAQIVNSIGIPMQEGDPQPLRLISVSRPAMALAHHLHDNYYYDKNGAVSAVIADKTIEELEALGGDSSLTGFAILVTDVISSGRLCERIARAFPKIKWLGTIGLLETRYDIKEHLVRLRNGVGTFAVGDTATGPTYALAIRKIQKFSPAQLGPVQATAIDEVNMCAVQSSEHLPDTVEQFWTFVKRKPEAIQIGHCTGNNHHYVYNVDVGQLLDANKAGGQSLLDFIVKHVSSALERKHYDPDATVIMHPPHDHSYAERIAKAVQHDTGVLFRHVLYKDNFAGHWRFSPFVQHGVPLKNCTLVLIDDGTNTAETLMGLLDAASFGAPRDVLAYVGITRMPPHKNHLFTNLKSLHGLQKNGTIKIEFILGLSIPVYSPRECPICRLVGSLTNLADNSSLLRRYSHDLIDSLRPGCQVNESDGFGFLWIYTSNSRLRVTELREALETLDYHGPSAELVESILSEAISSTSREALLNLAFVVCAEPDLVGATIFAPYLDSQQQELIRGALQAMVDCDPKELMTFVGFAFHLIARAYQRSPNKDPSAALNSFWNALLARREITTAIIGRVISFVLAEASREKGSDFNTSKANLSRLLLHELRREVNPRSRAIERIDSLAITRAFAYLFVREALAPRPNWHSSGSGRSDEARADFYEIATLAASHFWRHASDYIKADIDLLSEALFVDSPSTPDRLFGPIHSLIVSFDQLYELQERVRYAQQKIKEETNEALGMPNWDSPELSSAIARFMQALVGIAEEAEVSEFNQDKINEKLKSLHRYWGHLTSHLNRAFEEMLPEIHGVVANKWGKFAEEFGFPSSVAEPLKTDNSLSRDVRVFMPRSLVLRFLNASLQNLKSAAFGGWSAQDIASSAKAHIEISADGSQTVAVKVIDNGPSRSQETRVGDQLGLKNVRIMASQFGAELLGPDSNNGNTCVELRIRRRETGKG